MASMSREASFTDEGDDDCCFWGSAWEGYKGYKRMRLKDYIENFCYIWRWADDGVGNGFYPGQAY